MFEKIKEQRRVAVFFAVTYLVFGSAIFYLLFMTPGLDFVQEEVDGTVRVFLFNDSSHIITNIEIETEGGEEIAFVERLLPQKKALLYLGDQTGVLSLVAKAPYHATAKKSFSFVDSGGGEEIKLAYKVTAPVFVFVDFNFSAEIEVCNSGESLSEVMVEESHSQASFIEENETTVISLDVDECKKAVFVLTPKKAGQTQIYFNVKALSYSKQIEKEITIKE